MKSVIAKKVAETEEDIHISPLLHNESLLSCYQSDIKTSHDAFLHGLVISKNGPCLGWRPKPDLPYIWITYSQTLERAQLFGSGLALDGAQFKQSQLIGIYAHNRVEWLITAQACCSFSMILVPFFPTSSIQFLRHFINQYHIKFMVVDTAEKALSLLEECKRKRIQLQSIIMMDNDKDVVANLATETGVSVKWFVEVELFGQHSLKDFELPKPDDINSICFTSGVNDLPKGVILTHANFVANLFAVYAFGEMTKLPFKSSDVYLSFLSLSNSLERAMVTQMLYVGGSIGFYSGSSKRLLDDVKALQPTLMPLYPSLLSSVVDVMRNSGPRISFQRFLQWVGLQVKLYQFSRGVYEKDSVWDRLAFSDCRKLLGGRLQACVLGAETPLALQNFVRAALGLSLVTGYVLYEATCFVGLTLPDDFSETFSCYLLPCNAVKLVDVPDLQFFSKNGEGEILIKGANIFKEYHKETLVTKKVLDKEGWLHTGDVGRWLPNGGLQALGPKESVYRLLNSKIVVAEKIEFILNKTPKISQIFVYCTKKFSILVAIVVLQEQNLMEFLARFSHFHNKSLHKKVLNDLHKTGKRNNLEQWEIPKKIHVIDTPFTVENGLMTPTFKKRRRHIIEKYYSEFMQMLSNY